MAKKTRWMSWVLDESADTQPSMPWARNRRAAPAPKHDLRDLVADSSELSFPALKTA